MNELLRLFQPVNVLTVFLQQKHRASKLMGSLITKEVAFFALLEKNDDGEYGRLPISVW